MKRTWTIIGVRDVPGSFEWYQSLFGQPETSPGHDYFGQILDTDGTVLLCLHQWGAHEHPTLMSPDEAPPGQRASLVLPRRRFRHGPEEGTRSRRPVRRRTPREPEHSNNGVLTPGSGRILCHDQCDPDGLTNQGILVAPDTIWRKVWISVAITAAFIARHHSFRQCPCLAV